MPMMEGRYIVGRQIEAEKNVVIKNEEKAGGNGGNKKTAQQGRESGKMEAERKGLR